MELLNKIESAVTEVTYTLQDETSSFIYKEWMDSRGKVIDCLMRDNDGFDIDDPALLEKVQEFIDEIDG